MPTAPTIPFMTDPLQNVFRSANRAQERLPWALATLTLLALSLVGWFCIFLITQCFGAKFL